MIQAYKKTTLINISSNKLWNNLWLTLTLAQTADKVVVKIEILAKLMSLNAKNVKALCATYAGIIPCGVVQSALDVVQRILKTSE
ncbi:MAG: hypothetical protein V7739_01215 [Motiliproteus sp.]